MAAGSESNFRITEMVKEMGYEYHVIGDALKPAKILEAIWGGNEFWGLTPTQFKSQLRI